MTAANRVSISEAQLNEVHELREAIDETSATCAKLEKSIADKKKELTERKEQLDKDVAKMEEVAKGFPPSLQKLLVLPNGVSTEKRGRKKGSSVVTRDQKIAFLKTKLENGPLSLSELNKAIQDELGVSPGPCRALIGEVCTVKGKGRKQMVSV
jgi:hypothetical protein